MEKRSAFAIPALTLATAVGTVACAVAFHTAPYANHRLLFRLYDQGSTNTPAWILTVNTDGSGTLANDDTGSGKGNKDFKAGSFESSSLAAALDKLNVSHLPTCAAAEAAPPVKVNTGSASFGSYATLYYEGKVIKSFCLNNPAEAAITSQLSKTVVIANP